MDYSALPARKLPIVTLRQLRIFRYFHLFRFAFVLTPKAMGGTSTCFHCSNIQVIGQSPRDT
jgi:hypothetical protein